MDLPLRQQVKHQGAALADRRPVGASGRVHQPACGAAVEAGVAFQWHHQVDLAQRMAVVRAGDVLHVDDVDREAVQLGLGLEDAAIADAAAFALAQPAGVDAGLHEAFSVA